MIDPHKVPVWPVLKATLETDDDGRASVTLDGTPLEIPPHSTPQEALRRAAAERAAQRRGRIKAYRLEGHSGGHVFRMVVDEDGEIYDLTPRPRRSGRKIAAGIVAGASVLTAAGIAFIVSLPDDKAPAPTHTVVAVVTPTPQATEIPQAGPTGLSDRALWATGPVSSQAQIATTRDTIYAATGGDVPTHLAAINVASGAQQWSVKLPDSFQAQSGPTLTTYNGKPALALASSETLLVTDMQGQTLAKTALPINAKVLPGTKGVAVGGDNIANVLIDGHLVKRALPPSATPLGLSDASTLVAGSDDGKLWWITREDVAPNAVTVKAPKGMQVVKALGIAQGDPIVALSSGQSASTFKLARVGSNGLTHWLSGDITGSPDSLALSPSTTWSVIDNSAVDLTNGKTVKLADNWQTVGVSDDFAWGRSDKGLLTATVKGLTKASQDAAVTHDTDTGTPIGSAGGVVFMVAQDQSVSRLYALVPGK